MKKKLMFLFLILIFPFTINSVSAEITCTEVNDKVAEYNEIESEITDLKCSAAKENDLLVKCDDLSLELNLVLTDLFEIYDSDTYCDTTAVKAIVDKNTDKCTKEVGDTVNSIAKSLYRWFYIIGTFLFLILGSIDFFKNVIHSDPKQLPKNRKNFAKRAIALVLIFFLPMLINYIFSALSNHYKLGTNKYICVAKTYSEIEVKKADPTKKNEGNKGGNTTNKPKEDEATIKKKRAAIATAAKSVKEYHKKHKMHWCAKRYNSKGKVIHPACKTKYVELVLTSSNTQNAMSCATLVNVSLYKAGIYTKEDLNSHNINGARSTAIYLINKNWKVIKKKKNLRAGDVVFFTGTGYGKKDPVKVPGIKKKQKPGHVEIYAGDGKTYNTGGEGSSSYITKKLSGNFLFGLRYNGE